MKWYYVNSAQEKVETTNKDLEALLKSGSITKETLVWNETMTDWMPLETAVPNALVPQTTSESKEINPYAAPTGLKPEAEAGQIRELTGILAQNAGWIKFQGVTLFVSGILMCVTIVYAIVGWVPIWMGRLLMQAADAIRQAEATGREAEFIVSQEKLSHYFKISGIMMLIGLIFYAIAIVVVIISFIVAAATGGLEGM